MEFFRSFKARNFTPVEDKFPLVLIKDGVAITKNDQSARVIEIRGLDYTGMDEAAMEEFFLMRKMFFDKLPPNLTCLHQTHRLESSKDIEQESYSTEMAGEISRKWGKQFTSSFRSRHYLILVTAQDDFEDFIKLFMIKEQGGTIKAELERILDDATKDALKRFDAYGARELTGDDQASYWAWMINGRHVTQKLPENGLLDDLVCGTAIKFPKGKRYQVYEGTTGTRYSGWLYIKEPQTQTTSSALFQDIMKIKKEISVFQTFSKVEKQSALKMLDDWGVNITAFGSSNELLLMQLKDFHMRIEADQSSMIRHRFVIEVYGDSEKELEQNIRTVAQTVENWGYRTAREKMNQEACFWSRFPGLQGLNTRQRFISSANTAHFTTFANVGEGKDSCSWGSAPVTYLKTEADTQHAFIFHSAESKQALGNTMIVGGSGDGKTTLISFLISQCFKYPNFRSISFDQKHGMEVFTEFMDGKFIDFNERVDLNPFHMPDEMASRNCLSTLLTMMTGKNSPEDIQTINKVINQAYKLERSHRVLAELNIVFGEESEGSIRSAIQNWMPNGSYGWAFNGRRDALDFDNPTVTFDMTTVLDTPELLGPLTYYIFQRLFMKVRESAGGYLVFVDELAKYLSSEQFRPKVKEMLQEIRKTDGIFIGALQDPGPAIDGELAPVFKNNISTWLLFPNPRAEKDHYMDGLKLNDNEYAWIKEPHDGRFIMVKRASGESVILNVDLSPLGKYLNIFDSSKDASNICRTMKGEYGNEWKKHFLGK